MPDVFLTVRWLYVAFFLKSALGRLTFCASSCRFQILCLHGKPARLQGMHRRRPLRWMVRRSSCPYAVLIRETFRLRSPPVESQKPVFQPESGVVLRATRLLVRKRIACDVHQLNVRLRSDETSLSTQKPTPHTALMFCGHSGPVRRCPKGTSRLDTSHAQAQQGSQARRCTCQVQNRAPKWRP